MKKNLEKVFASASMIVAVILIMILLVTAFGGIREEEFNSQLVQGLLITLSVLYILLAIVSLVLIFVSSDVIKEIVIRSEQKGSVRVSVAVVNKLVKKTCGEIEGVKCNKVALISDDYGVRLKVNVKVVDKDVIEVETYIRTLLEDVFMGEFAFKFHSIEIKVISLQPKYKADKESIENRVQEKLAEMKEEQAKLADKDDIKDNLDTQVDNTQVCNDASQTEIEKEQTVQIEESAPDEFENAIEDKIIEINSETDFDADKSSNEESDFIENEQGEVIVNTDDTIKN